MKMLLTLLFFVKKFFFLIFGGAGHKSLFFFNSIKIIFYESRPRGTYVFSRQNLTIPGFHAVWGLKLGHDSSLNRTDYKGDKRENRRLDPQLRKLPKTSRGGFGCFWQLPLQGFCRYIGNTHQGGLKTTKITISFKPLGKG